mgnify:CR=1 FL=1
MDASADQKNPPPERPRIAYLFSRYPVVSQTFCDSEMLALESRGFDLDIASINPPPSAFRHERFDQFEAEVFYPPPSRALGKLKSLREEDGSWQARFGAMIARHDRDYGVSFKAATRDPPRPRPFCESRDPHRAVHQAMGGDPVFLHRPRPGLHGRSRE